VFIAQENFTRRHR